MPSPSTAARALRSAVALLGGLVLGGCSVVGVRGGTPQPRYTVVGTAGHGADGRADQDANAIEIRRYGDRLAAESVETGSELSARNTGFRRLAGYIFGGNRTDTRIAMTAPVAQAPADAPAAVPGPMSDSPASGGRWRIRFFLPDTLRAHDVPVPNDPSIRIVPVPGETVAVLRFSGTPDPVLVAARTRALLDGLRDTPWRVTGAPVAWFYDPPWTLPPLRRNEVAVPVSRRS